MTKQKAIEQAQREAHKYNMSLLLVKEGIHADEHEELDADGESYGFCPPAALPLVYKYGTVVNVITANQVLEYVN